MGCTDVAAITHTECTHTKQTGEAVRESTATRSYSSANDSPLDCHLTAICNILRTSGRNRSQHYDGVASSGINIPCYYDNQCGILYTTMLRSIKTARNSVLHSKSINKVSAIVSVVYSILYTSLSS